MNKLYLLLVQGQNYFGSGSTNTPEFKKFYLDFKREMKKELLKIDATDIEFSRGHFDLTGFFRVPSGQLYYISLSDVRHNIGRVNMLYRTAKHNKDWTGGGNQYIDIKTNMWDGVRL